MPSKQICATALEAVRDIADGASLLVHSFGPPQAWPTDCLLALAERGVQGPDRSSATRPPAGRPRSTSSPTSSRSVSSSAATSARPAIPDADQRAGEGRRDRARDGAARDADRARARRRRRARRLLHADRRRHGGRRGQGGTRVRRASRYVFERAIRADFALLQAYQADAAGNLTYRRGMRNFGPAFAMAAKTTIAEVKEIVPLGAIDPEAVVTPGIFVDRIVKTNDAPRHRRAAPDPADQSAATPTPEGARCATAARPGCRPT